MTVSLEEAKHLVGWSDDHEIVWHVREFPLGWCFWVEGRRFPETGNLDDVLFGSSTDFVIATTGEVIRTGSGLRHLNAEAHLLEMARLGLALDQSHFEKFTSDKLRQDHRFLGEEQFKGTLEELEP